jgi:hypothetical protein
MTRSPKNQTKNAGIAREGDKSTLDQADDQTSLLQFA